MDKNDAMRSDQILTEDVKDRASENEEKAE